MEPLRVDPAARDREQLSHLSMPIWTSQARTTLTGSVAGCTPGGTFTWSLVRRADKQRTAVLAVFDALCDGVENLSLLGESVWLPAGDPYRPDDAKGAGQGW